MWSVKGPLRQCGLCVRKINYYFQRDGSNCPWLHMAFIAIGRHHQRRGDNLQSGANGEISFGLEGSIVALRVKFILKHYMANIFLFCDSGYHWYVFIVKNVPRMWTYCQYHMYRYHGDGNAWLYIPIGKGKLWRNLFMDHLHIISFAIRLLE